MPRFEPHPARRPAIVAGASSGIGAATAVELAAHGFPVALGARRLDKCQEIVEKIRGDGGEAIALSLDVTDADSVKGFVHQATEQLGDIEVLVAGAGDTYFGRLHEIDTETFESQIPIHLIRSRDSCTRPRSSSATSRFSSPAPGTPTSAGCTKSTPKLSNRRSRSI